MPATCAAAPANSIASIAQLLGVSRSTIYPEESYISQQTLRRLDPPAHLSVLGQRQHQAELVGP
jgi:hypothetical protein